MMKQMLTACLFMSCVGLVLTAVTGCDLAALFFKLSDGKLSLAEYTRLYNHCISGKGGYTSGGSKYGYQPSCSADHKVKHAVAKFDNKGTFVTSNGGSKPFWVRGVVTFTEIDSKHTRIHASIVGTHAFLSDSKFFSLHVHELGETNPTCSSTGGHYNPCGKSHSTDPTVEDRHAGDVAHVIIPPYFSSYKDVLVIEKIDTQVKLSGPLSVLGRSVTVHGGSKSTRVGCGTIAVAEWEGKEHPEMVTTYKPYRTTTTYEIYGK